MYVFKINFIHVHAKIFIITTDYLESITHIFYSSFGYILMTSISLTNRNIFIYIVIQNNLNKIINNLLKMYPLKNILKVLQSC